MSYDDEKYDYIIYNQFKYENRTYLTKNGRLMVALRYMHGKGINSPEIKNIVRTAKNKFDMMDARLIVLILNQRDNIDLCVRCISLDIFLADAWDIDREADADYIDINTPKIHLYKFMELLKNPEVMEFISQFPIIKKSLKPIYISGRHNTATTDIF